MKTPMRPAAYVTGPVGGPQMTLAARKRGWPAPAIYADSDDGAGQQALARLRQTIAAGTHDAVLMAPPSDPSPVMDLLLHCTRHGVPVTFVTVPVPVPVRSAGPPQASATVGPPLAAPPSEPWDVLARARLEALAGLFPDWRIWLDHAGWHARRRDGFLQGYRPGAPAFHVSAESATGLAAQLCWQRSADEHAPDGCHSSVMSPPPWGAAAVSMRRGE